MIVDHLMAVTDFDSTLSLQWHINVHCVLPAGSLIIDASVGFILDSPNGSLLLVSFNSKNEFGNNKGTFTYIVVYCSMPALMRWP